MLILMDLAPLKNLMLENHIELGVRKIQIYREILQTKSPGPYTGMNQNLVRGIRAKWRLEIAKNLYIPKLKMAATLVQISPSETLL